MASLLEEGSEEVYKDLPYYNAILRSFFKKQILHLLEELASQTGEEAIILTANINNGTMSHLGTSTARGFIEGRDDIKSQFLSYCLSSHHTVSSVKFGSSSSLSSSVPRTLNSSMYPPPKRPRLDSSSTSSPSSSSSAAGATATAPVHLTHTDILENQTRAPVQKFFTSFNEAYPKISNKRQEKSLTVPDKVSEVKQEVIKDSNNELHLTPSAGSEQSRSQIEMDSNKYIETNNDKPSDKPKEKNISVNVESSASPATTSSTAETAAAASSAADAATTTMTGEDEDADRSDTLDPGECADSNDEVIIKREPMSDDGEDCEVMASWTQRDDSLPGNQSLFNVASREPGCLPQLAVFPTTSYTPARRKALPKARTVLTLKEKVQMICDHEKDPSMTQRKLAALYNCGKTAVGTVLRKKDMYLQQFQLMGDPERKRIRHSCKYAEVNLLVWKWFKSALENSEPISGPIIQQKALECAKELNLQDFKASNGWLSSWKSRFSVTTTARNRSSADSNNASNLSDSPEMDVAQISELKDNIWPLDDPCFTVSEDLNDLFASTAGDSDIVTRSKTTGSFRKKKDCIQCGDDDDHDDHDVISDSDDAAEDNSNDTDVDQVEVGENMQESHQAESLPAMNSGQEVS